MKHYLSFLLAAAVLGMSADAFSESHETAILKLEIPDQEAIAPELDSEGVALPLANEVEPDGSLFPSVNPIECRVCHDSSFTSHEPRSMRDALRPILPDVIGSSTLAERLSLDGLELMPADESLRATDAGALADRASCLLSFEKSRAGSKALGSLAIPMPGGQDVAPRASRNPFLLLTC